MYEKFLDLEEEKQKKILDAAMMEFSRYGYQKTSIAGVAKEANISKSMVFYYFTNKLSLYSYLVAYSSDKLLSYYQGYLEELKGLDYIQKIFLSSKIKARILLEEEAAFKFLTQVFLRTEEIEIDKNAKRKFHTVIEFGEQAKRIIQEPSHGEVFRRDLETDRIKKYIDWIIDGYSKEVVERWTDRSLAEENFEVEWKEVAQLKKDMERLFYKEDAYGRYKVNEGE